MDLIQLNRSGQSVDPVAIKNAQVPNKFTKVPTVQENSIQNFQGQSNVNFTTIPGFFNPVTMTMAPTTADTLYIIGDPTELLLTSLGLTLGVDVFVPDSGSINPGAFRRLLDNGSLGVAQMNYQTSSDTTQFNQRFDYLTGKLDGTYTSSPLQSTYQAAKRNTAYTQLLYTYDFKKGQIVLNQVNALLIKVLRNQVVSLTFTPDVANFIS